MLPSDLRLAHLRARELIARRREASRRQNEATLEHARASLERLVDGLMGRRHFAVSIGERGERRIPELRGESVSRSDLHVWRVRGWVRVLERGPQRTDYRVTKRGIELVMESEE